MTTTTKYMETRVMSQTCQSCRATMREYDTVAVLESGDVICKPCAIELPEYGLEGEIGYFSLLQDVHPDWRTQ